MPRPYDNAVRLIALMFPIAIATDARLHNRAPASLTQAITGATDGRATPGSQKTLPARASATAANDADARLIEITSMRVPRAAHTATTLPDGRVLVAGGFTNAESADKGAELYDAKTGQFAALPRMITLRHSHTATALPNGKILIVGGYAGNNEVTTAAELFDPATRTFVATGSLRSARAGHVAVLLNNGKVLIAGGVGPGWTFLSSAELYDPATGQFVATGAMTELRESHVAALLLDGRVLIAGGHRDRRENIKLYTSAEVYDVASGTFRRVGDMHQRRHKHDGVLLRDGRVLITGGSDERDDKGAYHSTEFFDPKSNTFAVGPDMKRARYKHNGSAVTLSNGLVLIAGGAAQAETFDPTTKMFTLVAGNAQMAGQFSAAARAGNGALVTGGYGGGTGPRASAWIYQP